MRSFLTRLLSLVLVCGTLAAMSTLSPAAEPAGAYRHVVLLKFKADATPEQVAQVETAFRKLKEQIDTITALEWGMNVSPEGKDDGFTHCFFLTFKDKAGLDVYLPHPAHKAFGGVLRPHLDKVLVIDYIAQP
jgi:Stress responsive A/B Barrel Domain